VFFFASPSLTLTGVIAPLTGCDGETNNSWLFGSAFLTPILALLFATQRRQVANHPLRFFAVCLNPIFMVSGWCVFKRRVHVFQHYSIVGTFFLFVQAVPQKLLALKVSPNPIETLLFGLSLEFYVYFNFTGCSLIAMSVMGLLGINAQLNFHRPLCATSAVKYWKRWHISQGNTLRRLFLNPRRLRWGLGLACGQPS
jgi:hypothetical protein